MTMTTNRIRVGSAVRSITVTQTSLTGPAKVVEIYSRKDKKRKKESAWVRMVGRFARRMARARMLSGQYYLERHDRSRRKKKNGWSRDFADNLKKARKDANKRAF